APEPSVAKVGVATSQAGDSPSQVAVAASPNSNVVTRSSGSTTFEYGSAVTNMAFFSPAVTMRPLTMERPYTYPEQPNETSKAAIVVGGPALSWTIAEVCGKPWPS